MTDQPNIPPEIPPEPEDHSLLTKLDAILQKYRKEYSAVMRSADLKVVSANPEPLVSNESQAEDVLPSLTPPEIPILTEKVVVTPEISFNESGISLLLCYAFDSALKDAKLNLTSSQRFALLQALAQRLPKNL